MINVKTRAFTELDTLRFFAVSLILLHHQYFRSNAVFRWFTDHGHIGVDIFFVISGFIITLGLMREVQRSGTVGLKNFWMRRILRLWPAWALALACSSVIVLALQTVSPQAVDGFDTKFWHYFLHFGNYSMAFYGKIHHVMGHFWSLAVEEHFYLSWPLLFYVSIRKPKLRIGLLTMMIVLPFLFRIYHAHAGDGLAVLYFSTHTRLDAIAFGCLFACFFNRGYVLKTWEEAAGLLGMLLLGYVGVHGATADSLPIFWQQLAPTCISVASCLLILVALNGSPQGPRRLLQSNFLSKLGILSYGVYLFHPHWNFVYFYSVNALWPEQSLHGVSAVVNFVVPYIPAYLVYVTIDAYFEKKKAHFR